MKKTSMRNTDRGMKIGGAVGFLAAGFLMIASRSFWFWHEGGHFYHRFTMLGLRLVPFVLVGGAVLGVLFGGLVGAFLDRIANRMKRRR